MAMEAVAEEEQPSRAESQSNGRSEQETETATPQKPKKKETTRLPLYTVRQPPLVQPLETSPFAERTIGQFGLRDLGHEWVTLFQTIGESNCGGYSKSMKLSIPDTILLSPSGLPSMWYSTSASSHIKPRNLMLTWALNIVSVSSLQRVTPHSILEAFTTTTSFSGLGESDGEKIVAIRRVGFWVESLTLRQLKDFCCEMEHPRVVLHRHEWEELDPDDNGDVQDEQAEALGGKPPQQPKAFCLQKHVPRDRKVSFLTLWRCKHRKKDASDNVTDKKFARSFYKRPLPLLTSDISSKCDVFLVRQRDPKAGNGRDSTNSSDDDEDDGGSSDDSSENGENGGAVSGSTEDVHVSLTHLDLESKTLFEDSLRIYGFDEDVILPQLYHMKLTASEILNRLNRGLQSRQACGILCEFFVGALDKKVYFSGLVGIHWEGCESSWEKLSHVDAISRAIAEFLDKKKIKRHTKSQLSPSSFLRHQSNSPSFATTNSMFPSAYHPPSQAQLLTSAAEEDNDAALRLYNELNPRFPSVQSPYVSEMQWRYQSPLLPPDISPRYIGAQVPKSYRDGKFHSLLTPKQADSVNRLNLSPRPPAALIVHHQSSLSSGSGSSLSKKQSGKLEQLGRPPQSPRSTTSSYKPVVGNNDGAGPRQFSMTRRAL